MLQLEAIPKPVFVGHFLKAHLSGADRMDPILHHLLHFASPNNDAIDSASEFQIFMTNEGYSI